jgi:hypothetical protein
MRGQQVVQPDHMPRPTPGDVFSWCSAAGNPDNPSDYPLSSPCAFPGCGLWVVRESVAHSWRHREPGEAPADQPAERGGFI